MTHKEEHRQHEDQERAFLQRYAYRFLLGLAVLALATGTVVYHFLEDWSWVDAFYFKKESGLFAVRFDSFYFSSVAVTTVGFGDLVPGSDASKLFTVAYIFSAIGIITAFLNVRLKRHSGALAERARKRR